MRGARICLLAIAVMGLAIATGASGGGISVGPGQGIQLPSTRPQPCEGNLLLTYDGTAENGYAWDPCCTVPPDFGAFAEGYDFVGTVCGIRYYFTTVPGYYSGAAMDAYVYAGDGDIPTRVLSVTPGIPIERPGYWPEVSLYEIDVADTPVDGSFFVGFWGEWPLSLANWFIAVDLRGAQGRPRTNMAPGIGYPTGWHDVEMVWGPTKSLGIGAYVSETPVPAPSTSWGAIKTLYK